MFASIDENPAMTLQDTLWTDAPTDARTDDVKTVYPPQTKFEGGIKMRTHDFQSDMNQAVLLDPPIDFSQVYLPVRLCTDQYSCIGELKNLHGCLRHCMSFSCPVRTHNQHRRQCSSG